MARIQDSLLLFKDPEEQSSRKELDSLPEDRKEILSVSFQKAGIDRGQLHNSLRMMGRDWLHHSDMEWSTSNPTRNYCYVVAEWLHRYIAPSGSQLYKVSVPGDEEYHRFNVWSDSGAVVDLTCEQFSDRITVPYHEAKPYVPLQMAGPMPSKRAQLLDHLYRGRSISSFKFIRGEKGPWRNPAVPKDWWAKLLSDWKDPYGAPAVYSHGRFCVVRDDLLKVGSKVRFTDALLSLYPNVKEWVYGSCPAQGFGQVSLAAIAKRHGKKATLFMAARSKDKLTPQQKMALSLGAKVHWVSNGFLTVTESRAKKYVLQDPIKRSLIPMGLDDRIILAAIIKVARSLDLPKVKEVWTVAGSGTLSRGLQMAFPNAMVHAVSVGHELTWEQRGRAKIWKHAYPFNKDAAESQLPPYPSLRNYDAKLWVFVRERGRDGALIWNVA